MIPRPNECIHAAVLVDPPNLFLVGYAYVNDSRLVLCVSLIVEQFPGFTVRPSFSC